mmetsp:Transcript_45963/g.147769  ORF Transcript_45963/g.147769 Transcript_45963/m.147769 type:complete len:285 (+) Transcript_45963:991-1845(+)
MHDHLHEVFPLSFKKHGEHSLEVPRDVQDVVTAEVGAHHLVTAIRESDPPLGAWPHPLLRGHHPQADEHEAAVHDRLHNGLRVLRELRAPQPQHRAYEGLDEEQPHAPIQSKEHHREDHENGAVPRDVRSGVGQLSSRLRSSDDHRSEAPEQHLQLGQYTLHAAPGGIGHARLARKHRKHRHGIDGSPHAVPFRLAWQGNLSSLVPTPGRRFVVRAHILHGRPLEKPDGHFHDEEHPIQLQHQERAQQGQASPTLNSWLRNVVHSFDACGRDDVAVHHEARDEE